MKNNKDNLTYELNKADLLRELKELLSETYEADLIIDKQKLILIFSNGQKFIYTIK